MQQVDTENLRRTHPTWAGQDMKSSIFMHTYRRPNPKAIIDGSWTEGSILPSAPINRSGLNTFGSGYATGSCSIALKKDECAGAIVPCKANIRTICSAKGSAIEICRALPRTYGNNSGTLRDVISSIRVILCGNVRHTEWSNWHPS